MTINDFVFKVVAQAFGKEISELNAETRLLEDLDAKSVNYFPFMNALEEEYDLDLEYQTVRTECKTVGDIVSMVEREA